MKSGSKSESGDDDAEASKEKESPRSSSVESSYWLMIFKALLLPLVAAADVVAVPRDDDMRNEDDSIEVPTE